MNPKLTIFCDGGSRGNPGPAAYGFVITSDDGTKVYEEGKTIGVNTNNVAEYSAVVGAFKYLVAQDYKVENITFFMDSKLVAEQMSGRWKIKNENLRSLHYTIKEMERKIGAKISYNHVPREQNTEADKLVNLALDGIY